MWPIFFTGFAFMFVFTYMYAFNVSKKIYGIVTATYIGFLAWLYLPAPMGFGRSLQNLISFEFLWIPIILYWIPIILYGLATLFAFLAYLKNKK